MNRILAMGMAIATAGGAAVAQEMQIAPGLADVRLSISGAEVTISRTQDTTAVLEGDLARLARPCPGECIQPMTAAPGVATLGELELIEFLTARVATEQGLLVDTRLPQAFAAGNIPGSVNVPKSTLQSSNPFRTQILLALGAREESGGLNFADAKHLALYCDGPWCGGATESLRNLVEVGYPVEKLSYYRGGIQSWRLMGFNLRSPQ